MKKIKKILSGVFLLGCCILLVTTNVKAANSQIIKEDDKAIIKEVGEDDETIVKEIEEDDEVIINEIAEDDETIIKRTTKDDEAVIKEIIEDFMEAKNSYIFDGKLGSYTIDEVYKLTEDKTNHIFAERNYSTEFFISSQSYQYASDDFQGGVEDYISQYIIEELSIDEESAFVKVVESVQYRYILHDYKSVDDWSGKDDNIWIKLAYNEGWKIYDITMEVPFYSSVYNSKKTALLSASDAREEVKTRIENIGVGLHYETVIEEEESTYEPFAIKSYNPSKAVAYAIKHYSNYNFKFPSYADEGGDCANFGSQCIWVGLGGNPDDVTSMDNKYLPMVDLGKNHERSWYHTSTRYDKPTNHSWTSTRNFYTYVMAGNPDDDGLYGTSFNLNSSSDYYSVRVGDIVQVGGDAGAYAHTVIVTSISSDTSLPIENRIKVTGHSQNRLNDSLSNYTKPYRAVRIQGVVGTIPGDWIKDSVGWWYRHKDGKYIKSDWERINGEWYYFDSVGYMVTGWIEDGSHWYYCGADGAMVVGEYYIDGRWSLFDDPTGRWLGYIN